MSDPKPNLPSEVFSQETDYLTEAEGHVSKKKKKKKKERKMSSLQR